MPAAGTGILALCLVGCRQPPPDPAALARMRRAECVADIRHLALCTVLYAREHDGRLPRANSGGEAMLALDPYLRGRGSPKCPETGRPFAFNVALSGAPRPSTRERGSIPVFRDFLPHADGSVSVAFLDGHAAKLPQREAERLGGRFR